MDDAGKVPLDLGLMQVIERYLDQVIPTQAPTAPLLNTLLRVLAGLLVMETEARELRPEEADGFVTIYITRLLRLVEEAKAYQARRRPAP